MARFSRNTKKQKEKMSEAPSKQGNSSISFYKLDKAVNKFVILPAIDEDADVIFEAPEHSIWSNGRLVKRCGSPDLGDKDKIEQLSIDLYVKAKKLSNDNPKKKKMQELASQIKPKISAYANIVDVAQSDMKVQQCRLPVAVTEF